MSTQRIQCSSQIPTNVWWRQKFGTYTQWNSLFLLFRKGTARHILTLIINKNLIFHLDMSHSSWLFWKQYLLLLLLLLFAKLYVRFCAGLFNCIGFFLRMIPFIKSPFRNKRYSTTSTDDKLSGSVVFEALPYSESTMLWLAGYRMQSKTKVV